MKWGTTWYIFGYGVHLFFSFFELFFLNLPPVKQNLFFQKHTFPCSIWGSKNSKNFVVVIIRGRDPEAPTEHTRYQLPNTNYGK